jgi:hypothetical protein
MVDPLVVARVGYNHGKLKGYSQVDMEGGDPRFGIAANAQTRFNADEDADAFIVIGADYAFKAYGLGISGGLFADWAQTGSQYKDQTFQSVGFFHELSFLFDDVIAPAVRYARIMPDGADNDVQEILGGLGVFPFKHNVKVQADAGPIITDTTGEAEIDYAVRTQLQVGF